MARNLHKEMNATNKGSIIKAVENKVVLYTDKRGNVELRADVEKDTIWATQDQIARLFEIERSVVTKHIRNILRDKELKQDSVCAKFAHTAEDGKRYLTSFYNLDVVLAVGYRTNSTRAIQFRQWATRILREYLIKGFNLNKRTINRSTGNVEDLQKALAFMGSENIRGALKGKLTLKVTKNVTQ